MSVPEPLPAHEALRRLLDGNRRFVAGRRTSDTLGDADRRDELVEGQRPIAVVLGCADSRVPAELVFDQGLGDLFVVRVAGNIVAPSQVASVEFAAEAFGTRLVVVLGHTRCGAVEATLKALREPERDSGHMRSIIDRIRPAVQALIEADPGRDLNELARAAARANVRAGADHLRHGSLILEELVRQDGLLVVGAEYALETGVVTVFDGLPAGL